MPKVNVILPIRSGSKRIVNKNIKLINNKPLYQFIVHTLKNCKYIEKIIINTDYEIIYDRYRNDKKVNVIKRKDHLKGNCNINYVIKSTLEETSGNYFLQTHVTNPLLKSDTIDNAIELYFKNIEKYSCLFSVHKVQKRFWDSNAEPINHNYTDEPTTQSLETYYEENSCLYIFSRESFLINDNRIDNNNKKMFEISKKESWDIDDEDDFVMVSKLLKN